MIAAGHPPAAVWKYSPRQMSAFLFIAEKRRTREDKRTLRLQAMAARGDPKAVQRTLRERED